MGIEMTKFLKKSVQLCLDNVEQYIMDAQFLVENGSYGHAFALAVLGEEELSKSFIYYTCSEGFLPVDIVKKVGRTRESHIRKQASNSCGTRPNPQNC
jgi:AbiV family abortive infection protein